jgi:adenine-specific DNA-methyltransferase
LFQQRTRRGVIKYLGSKRTLLPVLEAVVASLPHRRSFADAFSGTSRVGMHMKHAGMQVFANDLNAYATTLARCYVEADVETVGKDARRLVRELNRLVGRPGYMTHHFCEKARFFRPENGAKIDAIRDAIDRKSLPPDLKAVMLVSLMEAADRVDSTCGVHMAYLKKYAARADNALVLRVPTLTPASPYGKSRAHQGDAERFLKSTSADIIYLDPPYNQHNYLSNYHIWETLVLWDRPETYGMTEKRADCRTRKSAFNAKASCMTAMRDVIAAARGKHLVVSFSDEGHIRRADMETMLAERGRVSVVENDYRRYVGAQIGIHNLKGEVVGEVSHLRNVEYIYIVDL